MPKMIVIYTNVGKQAEGAFQELLLDFVTNLYRPAFSPITLQPLSLNPAILSVKP